MSIEGVSQSVQAEPKQFGPEWLKSRSTLEIEARFDAAPVLERLNERLGTKMQPSPDGFHVTVIGPTEYGSIKDLGDADLEELHRISERIQNGEGVIVAGVGCIDGATASGMREADKLKKTSYIALDIPELNAFREKHGLPKKDFHVTVGFEVGDIHMQVVGTEPGPKGKMKDIVAPIEKKADPAFEGLIESVELTFGEIDGQEKQKAAEKPKKAPEAPKEYSEDMLHRLRDNLGIYVSEGGIPSEFVDDVVKKISKGDVKALGQTYGKYMKIIRAAMIASEKEGS
ncbi:hypothetical protein WDW86_02455 [Bdellovibrionota bacterium FG-2]